VDKINSAIHKEYKKEKRKKIFSIGLLDIFGFENFGDNRSCAVMYFNLDASRWPWATFGERA